MTKQHSMYKPWFPQRNMMDSPVAVLKNFIFYLQANISRYTIEKACKEHPGYPNFTTTSLIQLLESWGIQAVVLDWTIPRLAELPTPSLLFINEKNGPSSLGLFVMKYEITADSIEYLHPRKGWVIEANTEFAKKWENKVLIATNVDASKGESNFEELEDAYEKERFQNPGMKCVLYRKDFLTPEECEYIMNLANPVFQPSKLMTDDGLTEYFRTSYSAELVFPDDEILNSIRKRSAEWLKIPEANFEFFQCVSYWPGQEYQAHYDTFDEKFEQGKEELEKIGQRKYTMLAYLNDDFVGGETYFPLLDLLIQPKKGGVLVFENLDDEGKILKTSLHAGLPVTEGNKIAMNMWIRTKPVRD